MERNLRFKIDWASLIVGRKSTVLLCFTLYIWRGYLTEGFLRYEFGGLIFGGAYTYTRRVKEGLLFGILR